MTSPGKERERTTVGVIGAGNMGSALVKGWLSSRQEELHLVVWDVDEACLVRLPVVEGLSRARSLEDIVAQADVIMVVVKPQNGAEVLRAIAGRLREEHIVVSAMAGVDILWIRGILGPGPRLFRIMPNLGVELGAGAVALTPEPGTAEAACRELVRLLEPLGSVEIVPEDLLDVVTALSGSGPAFVALAMEGLEDGAVAAGMGRSSARTLVRQAALTTAQLLPLHFNSPVALRQHLAVAGQVEERAIAVLEERRVRVAFRQAVETATRRSQQLRDAQQVANSR